MLKEFGRNAANTAPYSYKNQLLVDISILWRKDAGTGIQRVVRALSEQLLATELEDYQVHFVAATRRKRYRYLERYGADGADFRLGKRVHAGAGDVFLGLDLCSRILPRRKRQIKSWRKRGARICVVVYDLLPTEKPEWFSQDLATEFTKWLRFIGQYADQALCISQTVAKNLEQWLQKEHVTESDRLDVRSFPLGGDLHKSRPSVGISNEEAHALSILEGRRFVLTVGTIEPRKGHAIALDAFDFLFKERADEAPDYVIVGRPGWKTEQLQERMRQHTQQGKKFFWFNDASDELLDKLYQRCSGVLFPTLAEGFGLPVIEALTHNRPVLVRDIPVFRELEAPLVSYFEDDTPAILGPALLDWLKRGVAEHDMIQCEIFTWKKSCNALLQCLEISKRFEN